MIALLLLSLAHAAPAVQLTERVEPDYPEHARGLPLAPVTCAVNLLINEQGEPEQATASACPEPFRVEAERALRQWRFAPQQLDGAPLRFQTDTTLSFAYDPAITEAVQALALPEAMRRARRAERTHGTVSALAAAAATAGLIHGISAFTQDDLERTNQAIRISTSGITVAAGIALSITEGQAAFGASKRRRLAQTFLEPN